MMMQSMCTHIARYGGSALIGDYGHWAEKGDTLRVRKVILRLIQDKNLWNGYKLVKRYFTQEWNLMQQQEAVRNRNGTLTLL